MTITLIRGDSLNFKWPYHAAVIKTFEIVRSTTVRIDDSSVGYLSVKGGTIRLVPWQTPLSMSGVTEELYVRRLAQGDFGRDAFSSQSGSLRECARQRRLP